ncbi:hypothetical protein ACOME3_005925 [Neoechinorhynchus agilis]
MSIQWTFAASFLYTEIAIVFILLLPISPLLWRRFLHWKLIKALSAYANLYFNVIICIFLMLFADSVRELRKYARIDGFRDVSLPHAEHHVLMKQFRAQRNFYIAGFVMFLWLVISRLIKLILNSAALMVRADAMTKQAMSSNRAAQQMMEDVANATDSQELENKIKDLDIVHESLKKEYDTLQKEHEKLQRKFDELTVVHGQGIKTD